MSYERYIEEVTEDVSLCLENMGCQPILFVGSGISKRYFNGPNWEQLLRYLASNCPRIEEDFLYYKQTYNKDLIEIGKVFSDKYREWAWREGKDFFPPELFEEDTPPDIYIKYMIKEYLEKITPDSLSQIQSKYSEEISALQEIRPHAIITTNYDNFLEMIFHEYTPIIGQQVLKLNHTSIGEIFKIHGCISKPESLILTSDDYKEFTTKKKYLSAKLLTYFAEHPLLFVGYSAEDPNIKSILCDIDEIIATNNELIPNIYILEWDDEIRKKALPSREKLISVDPHRSVRIKSIVADSFDWVFKAFGTNGAIEKVNPKLLRAIIARTYEMVRCDIPRKTVEVDFKILENALNIEGELAKIYGITTLTNPTALNAGYPFNLTQVANQLGYKSWHHANRLIEQIKVETGINIKTSDNKYHIRIKVGNTDFSKYSEAAVILLKKVKNKEQYTVEV